VVKNHILLFVLLLSPSSSRSIVCYMLSPFRIVFTTIYLK
jgi:hypothetical protein